MSDDADPIWPHPNPHPKLWRLKLVMVAVAFLMPFPNRFLMSFHKRDFGPEGSPAIRGCLVAILIILIGIAGVIAVIGNYRNW
jgi:hypothetical protein